MHQLPVRFEGGGWMKIEDQVCNVDLSFKIDQLDIETESLFYWQKPKWLLDLKGCKLINSMHYEIVRGEFFPDYYPAFTVAELGEVLPNGVCSGKHENKAAHKHGKYHCKWFAPNKHIYNQRANTEADARAKMLIYLIENKLIKEPNEKV